MSEEFNDKKVKEILSSEKIPERLEPEHILEMLDSTGAAQKRKKIRKKRTLKFVSIAAAAAITVGISAYALDPALHMTKCNDVHYENKTAQTLSSMKYAKSYDDIYSCFFTANFINNLKDQFAYGGTKNDIVYGYDKGELNGAYADEAYDTPVAEGGVVGEEDGDMNAGADLSSSSMAMNEAESENAKTDFSDTYNQEEGVLEADIVKTDGKNLFYSNSDKLNYAQTDKGKFVQHDSKTIGELLGLDDSNIDDMYIYNGKLIVIGECCDYNTSENDIENQKNSEEDIDWVDSDDTYCYDYSPNSKTYIAILSYANGLSLDGWYAQDGSYNDVRLMSNGFLYVVSNDDKYLDFNTVKKDDVGQYIPEYGICGTEKCIEPEDILIPPEKLSEVYNYISYTNISGFNLNNSEPWNPVDMKSVAGYTDNIYCSQKNLYVVSGYDESEITRFALNDGTITPEASGKVNGNVLNQFSMSEYNGYFRVAVNENVWSNERFYDAGVYVDEDAESSSVVSRSVSQKNSIYVLDMNMNIVGSITNLGLDEEIKSVNFNGNTAYVVTFRQTDPLYAVDLSDPTAPVLQDELKISGYSSYMQKWEDGLLLGFGAEAAPDTGSYKGIKLTMFDNSDPNNLKALNTVSIIEKESVNDYNYISSEALYERKALYIDPERNIIGFPLTSEKNKIISNYDSEWTYNNSYEFYSFENGKFVHKGSIDADVNYGFERAVFIDGFIYAFSYESIVSVDAATFTKTDTLILD